MDLSDLNISIDLPAPAKIVTCTIEGAIEAEDIAGLLKRRGSIEAPMGMVAGDLARVREKHHAIARYAASGGMTNRMIGELVGLGEQYVGTLMNSPSMQELIGYYRLNHLNAAQQVSERLKHVALKAVDALDIHLDAGELEPSALLGLAKLGLDRSGHGPQSKQTITSEHHLIDHAELARLNRAARAESAEHIVNADFVQIEDGTEDEPTPAEPVLDVETFLASRKLL